MAACRWMDGCRNLDPLFNASPWEKGKIYIIEEVAASLWLELYHYIYIVNSNSSTSLLRGENWESDGVKPTNTNKCFL